MKNKNMEKNDWMNELVDAKIARGRYWLWALAVGGALAYCIQLGHDLGASLDAWAHVRGAHAAPPAPTAIDTIGYHQAQRGR